MSRETMLTEQRLRFYQVAILTAVIVGRPECSPGPGHS
jgi:hypothetical protein